MNKKIKVALWILPLTVILVFVFLHTWVQAQCDYPPVSFTEDFGMEDYKDNSHCFVQGWIPAPITLNYLGASFELTRSDQIGGIGARIYVCDSGDFNGDGKTDLIGLDSDNNRLILIRNNGINFLIDPTEVYEQGPHLAVGSASISTGDYNNDGLIDFFFCKNQVDEFGYTEFLATLYVNAGIATNPDFMTHDMSPNLDFTSAFMSAGIYINGAADHLASVDIDGDADVDVLVISQDKIYLVRNPGPANFSAANFDISELNYDQTTGFNDPTRGGTTIDAADFDKDGDIDVIGGTVMNVDHLVYYENDGTGYFTRRTIPIPVPECTGTVATVVADFNNDGWMDIFAANDGWATGNETRIYMWKNLGLMEISPGVFQPDFEFSCLNGCLPFLPNPHGVIMSTMVDYEEDGDADVFLADANPLGEFYLIINELADVYTLSGEARSTNVAGDLDQRQYAITQVMLKSITQGVLGGSSQGLTVEFYVSNNGTDWELYTRFVGADIQNQSDLPWHTFNHYGSRLYWKALLLAEDDDMVEYENASYETPAVWELTLWFTYVDRREYSRTPVAITHVDDNGQRKEFVIGGTFYFPGWQGHLRAYDVTDMTPEADTNSVLRTVTRSSYTDASGREIVASGVTIEWDAGDMLDSRSAGSRTIYTSFPGVSGLRRTDFTEVNVAVLGPILKDVNNDNAGLINFVRGEGRYWKLGDINHSRLIVVGPPDGDAGVKGSGYDAFLTANQNRVKVVYLGANDGMLHCFNALTGEELWGYIPYNLLPKLRSMWAVDSATGERYFSRDVYVDGSPVVEDVYIDTDGFGGREWRTVLICGQGPGYGSSIGGGLNYYFALDVTDPYDPQPLWEFTDVTMGETWSVPTIGKVTKEGVEAFVAFMGSGYDNDNANVVGNRFYAVDIETGTNFWSYAAADVDTSSSFPNIPNTIPGSPSSIDLDENGFLDSVYFTDLDGRVYRLNAAAEFRAGGTNTWDREVTVVYEDANNYPIVTKPAVWMNPTSLVPYPHVYFGTGGDDRAPSNITYSFVSLIDSRRPAVEWFMGDPALTGLDASLDMGDLGVGEKVWADPEVANSIVYFSTLTGSIESVDPCANLAGIGKLYGRYVQSIAGSAVGSTAFSSSTGTVQNLELSSKTRAAVTLGETERIPGGRKREVYIQEYDSTIQKLEQPVGAVLYIKSWREILKVIR